MALSARLFLKGGCVAHFQNDNDGLLFLVAAVATNITNAVASGAAVRPGGHQDYRSIPLHCPMVIDNGAYHCRVGWAGEDNPRLSFRNILNKPRQRASSELVSLVGVFDPSFVKLFDFTRSSICSAFDGNVVYQFKTMECILDYAFDRMGCDAAGIEHPILLTEGACNPLSSRNRMAELLFETYGVPSLECLEKLGVCDPDGSLVNIGHQTTHVIPGNQYWRLLAEVAEPQLGAFRNNITWKKTEELKQEHYYIAEDYHQELSLFEKGGPDAEAKQLRI